MFLLNGQPLQLDTQFSYNGVEYPSNWLRLASLEEKEAIGITEVADGTRPNDEYYWVTDNNDGTYGSTPKQLDDSTETIDEVETTTRGLKSIKVAQIKSTTNSLLARTDWMVIRKMERDIDIPTDTATFRASVITESNNDFGISKPYSF